jgi:hypothetical protein
MFAKSKLVRWVLCACLALPIGYALLQPTEVQAAWFYRHPIYRPAPIVTVAPVVTLAPAAPVTTLPAVVNVGPVVPVNPVYPYSPYHFGYGWRWNGYRWVR